MIYVSLPYAFRINDSCYESKKGLLDYKYFNKTLLNFTVNNIYFDKD